MPRPKTLIKIIEMLILASLLMAGRCDLDEPINSSAALLFGIAIAQPISIQNIGQRRRNAVSLQKAPGMLSSREPAWSHARDRIAFAVDGEDESGIYTMTPDGRDVRRLTGEPNGSEEGGTSPSWSPDGQQLLYIRPAAIWVMHADGTAKHQLSRAEEHVVLSSPIWSPDSTRIAYLRSRDREGPRDTFSDAIWVMDSAGRNARPLATVGRAQGLTWSPDGRMIAFERQRADSVAVYVLDVASGRQRRLTSSAHRDGAPSWSADGRQLAIVRTPEPLANPRSDRDVPAYHGRLVILNADGSDEWLEPNVFDAFTGSAPAWSPDARRVIYACGPPEAGPGGPNATHLCSVTLPNGYPHRISWSIRTTRFPAWSPDGRRIAYVLHEDGDSTDSQLRVATLDATYDSTIVTNLDVVSPPTWSPDGRRLAMLAASRSPRYTWASYGNALLVLDGLGATPRMIPVQTRFDDRIFGLEMDAPPVWSPDGHRIAVEAQRNPSMLDFRRSVFVVGVDDSAQAEPGFGLDFQFRPAWSPDGRWLAVTATTHFDSASFHIFLLDGSGKSKPKMLSDHPELFEGISSWSSDGKSIAYLSGRLETTGSTWTLDQLAIRVIPSDGGTSEKRAQIPTPSESSPAPVWSPNARAIALVMVDSDKATSRILAIDAEDGTRRWVTTDVRHAYDPAWSPDGRWLAFVSDRDGGAAVYIVDATGHNERRLAPTFGHRPLSGASLSGGWTDAIRR